MLFRVEVEITDTRTAHRAWAAACAAPVDGTYPAAFRDHLDRGASILEAHAAAEQVCADVDTDNDAPASAFRCQRPGDADLAWGLGASRVTLTPGDTGYTLRITGPASSSVILRAEAAADVLRRTVRGFGGETWHPDEVRPLPGRAVEVDDDAAAEA